MGVKVSGVKVSHPNGYSGILYGESSMSIYNEGGVEILHTGSRNINTKAELYDVLEGMPEFIKACDRIISEEKE